MASQPYDPRDFTNPSSSTLPILSKTMETKKSSRLSKFIPGRGKEKERQLLEQQEAERRQRDQDKEAELSRIRWQLEKERKDWAEKENMRALKAAQEASRIEYEKQQELERAKTIKRREKERQTAQAKKAKQVSPEKLRELRDLIRLRYELDVQIWNLRGVRKPDRPIVEEKMEKADSVLQAIEDTIRSWEDTRSSWTQEEWDKIGDVFHRITLQNKRWWTKNPPWEG
jgi:hypothetical protein